MQKVVERARRHAEMRRQPAIERMGHLIEVVADAPQFGEQRGIESLHDQSRGFRLATQESHLAIDGEFERRLLRFV